MLWWQENHLGEVTKDKKEVGENHFKDHHGTMKETIKHNNERWEIIFKDHQGIRKSERMKIAILMGEIYMIEHEGLSWRTNSSQIKISMSGREWMVRKYIEEIVGRCENWRKIFYFLGWIIDREDQKFGWIDPIWVDWSGSKSSDLPLMILEILWNDKYIREI